MKKEITEFFCSKERKYYPVSPFYDKKCISRNIKILIVQLLLQKKIIQTNVELSMLFIYCLQIGMLSMLVAFAYMLLFDKYDDGYFVLYWMSNFLIAESIQVYLIRHRLFFQTKIVQQTIFQLNNKSLLKELLHPPRIRILS